MLPYTLLHWSFYLSIIKMPKFLFLKLVLVSSILQLAACGDKVKDTHPQQLVSKRQAVFKKMTKVLEPMGLVARGREDYNKAEFQAQARELQDLSSQPWVFFTADGNYPPTRAKPEVWQKAAEFKQAQDSYLSKVEHLIQVSGSADLAAISSAVDSVEKSCKSCHEQFRNEH